MENYWQSQTVWQSTVKSEKSDFVLKSKLVSSFQPPGTLLKSIFITACNSNFKKENSRKYKTSSRKEPLAETCFGLTQVELYHPFNLLAMVLSMKEPMPMGLSLLDLSQSPPLDPGELRCHSC